MKVNGAPRCARHFVTGLAVLLLSTLLANGYGLQPLSTSAARLAQQAAGCSGSISPALTEGPYYKAGSPERTSLLEPGSVGTKLALMGYVFDKNCRPFAHAWLDFWQADGNGVYDNT